jgi:hypothetical protein
MGAEEYRVGISAAYDEVSTAVRCDGSWVNHAFRWMPRSSAWSGSALQSGVSMST